MGRRVSTPTGAKKKADELFSRIIRSAGKCAECGATDSLQCCHVLSRRFANTRCEEANAFCLCAGCHHFFTDHPVDWGRWVLTRMTEDEYDRLYALAHSLVKVNWFDVADRLAIRWKQIQAEEPGTSRFGTRGR